jgi:hypothetical protein
MKEDGTQEECGLFGGNRRKYIFSVRKPERKRPLVKPKLRRNFNVKMDSQVGCEGRLRKGTDGGLF